MRFMLFSIFGCKRQARIEADTLYQKLPVSLKPLAVSKKNKGHFIMSKFKIMYYTF